MRVPLSWLREFVPIELGVEDLVELLALKGMPVEAVERPWAGLEGVLAARVLEVRDHPNAEKLCIARVAHGSGEAELVVGVRNMRPGDIVPWAPPGARVPAVPEPLEARQIRGVVSRGMLCSARELAISQDHSGIVVFAPGEAEPGADVAALLRLDDIVLDLEIESNRPDLLSVVGIARELAAATGLSLARPSFAVEESEESTDSIASVRVEDPEGCPRYAARVLAGMGAGRTPLRAQARLTAAGTRPISPAVDATNYVMLELGQPLHAFDLALVSGGGIVVRRAAEGERLVTLDGVERSLLDDDLVISDLERPIAIAGVMGGAVAEVGDGTNDILLESAYFEPRGVLRTSRRMQLLTEASIRFSRGTDPEVLLSAADRAAAMMAAWTGAKVLRGALDVGAAPPRRVATSRIARASHLLGYRVEPDEAVEALGAIELPAAVDHGVLSVEVPGFRPDISEEVDLIEEIVRIQGYDRLPSTVPRVPQAGGEQASYVRRRQVRQLLRAAGLREAVSLSFTGPGDVASFGGAAPIVVANPPSAQQPLLRTSLLPNLVDAAARNVTRGVRSVALFEVGHVFGVGDPVHESERAAALLMGAAGVGLHAERRDFDVLDVKGALEVVLSGLGVSGSRLAEVPEGAFHPGRSARLWVGEQPVGLIGELAPSEAASRGLEARVAVLELDLDALEPFRTQDLPAGEAPRFPPVRRDLAFELPRDVPAGEAVAVISEAGGELLANVTLFDVFEGPSLRTGTRSLAFALEVRSAERTLTDEEADEVVGRIVDRVREGLGGTLRTG